MPEKSSSHSRLKTLHMIDSMEVGGAQRLLKEYFEYRSWDRDIHLYALRADAGSMHVSHPNVHTNRSKSCYSLSPLPELITLVKRKSIDVLHCHLIRAQWMGLFLKLFAASKTRLLFHIHSLPSFERRPWLFKTLTWLPWRGFSSNVAMFIAPSGQLKQETMRLYSLPQDKIRVVPNFIGRQFSRHESTEHAGKTSSNGMFHVGFAGRLESVKGWKHFVALATMYKGDDSVHFLMAGDGGQRETLNRLLSEHPLINLEYRGLLKDMTAYYRQLDCLVVPSMHEGFCLAAVEALACGVPVVAFDVPGLNSIVEHGLNGLVCAPGDMQALARNVETLKLEKGLRERLASAGPRTVEKYTIESFDIGLKKVLQELA